MEAFLLRNIKSFRGCFHRAPRERMQAGRCTWGFTIEEMKEEMWPTGQNSFAGVPTVQLWCHPFVVPSSRRQSSNVWASPCCTLPSCAYQACSAGVGHVPSRSSYVGGHCPSLKILPLLHFHRERQQHFDTGPGGSGWPCRDTGL